MLAPFLILVAALLESSMPANPSSYFGDISAQGSAVVIFIDELFSQSCQTHIEFPWKFDQRLADFQSVLVGFPMDSWLTLDGILRITNGLRAIELLRSFKTLGDILLNSYSIHMSFPLDLIRCGENPS